MKLSETLMLVESPLLGDEEAHRWYADGGAACLVLTESGQLLEPAPTYGPSFYRLIASEVDFPAANVYAETHGFITSESSTRCASGSSFA